MKKAALFILFSCCNTCLFAQKKIDTTFIKDHSVFVVDNRHSAVYSTMANIPLDSNGYTYSINEAKKQMTRSIGRHELHGLPCEWRQVVRYKGKYYSYLHEDLGNEVAMFNDSVAIGFVMDGLCTAPIMTVNKKGKYRYEIICAYSSMPPDTTNIYIVDPVNGIAVFKSGEQLPSLPYRKYYSLMMDTRKIKNLPVIVSYDPENRTAAFRGEKINYERLIADCCRQ